MGESERPYARSIFQLADLQFPRSQPGVHEFLELNTGKCAVANGCFDVLHPGHLMLLSGLDYLARMHGLRPLVALNSDTSVRCLKGTGRPIVPERARAELIASLRWPLSVVVFDQPTPHELMELLQPPLVVKGSEYVGRDVVRWRHSQVLTVPMEGSWSTTGILGDRV